MKLQTQLDETVHPISLAYTEAAGSWTGCDWPTEFGQAHLNLDKLTSAGAILMARATAGGEEDAWWEASRWLAHVEQEALEAEKEARVAVHASESFQWVIALTHARNACDIEARYHTHLIWKTLRDAIEKALRNSSHH
jgi:hypothetical protein